MENEIMLADQSKLSTDVKEVPLTDLALEYMQASKSENTLANYRHSMKLFNEYMIEQYGLDMRQADHCRQVTQQMICNYLSYLTSEERAKKGKKYKPLKASSVLRHLSAIRDFFGYIQERAEEQGELIPNPTKGKRVDDTVKGIQRRLGTAPMQKRAITPEIEMMILSEIKGERLADYRDAAIISLGFAGALRRSEIAQINIEDIHFKDSGLLLYLPKSKTDQTGEGKWLLIAYGKNQHICPVRLVGKWIRKSGITEGALFRSIGKGDKLGERIHPASIARIVKKRAKQAGLDESLFSGHSMRRGFVTHAREQGLDALVIMEHTRHERVETLRRYIEMIDVEKKSITKGLY